MPPTAGGSSSLIQSRAGPSALPPAFLRRNEDDPDWLRDLPHQLERFAALWSLSLQPHFPGIEYNYVAPVTRADGSRAVFKISRHVDETRNEIAALYLWDGDGAARLLEADPDAGALLIERLEPGTMLSKVAETDDDAATRIAAEMLRKLWRPSTERDGRLPARLPHRRSGVGLGPAARRAARDRSLLEHHVKPGVSRARLHGT